MLRYGECAQLQRIARILKVKIKHVLRLSNTLYIKYALLLLEYNGADQRLCKHRLYVSFLFEDA